MLKSLARRTIDDRSWLYMMWCRERFGLSSALWGYARMLFNGGEGSAPNKLMGGNVVLRPGTTDQNVYDQVFTDHEYEDIDFGTPEFIIDAGAHIGMSTIFFATRFPKATVVAVEPESSNYRLLCRNVVKCGNVKPVQAGLWGRSGKLRIQDPEAETWGFRVAEDEQQGEIDALSIPDLMKLFGRTSIDVLKIDIEGAEIEVLNESPPWLSSVRMLLVELHDRFRPGCSKALEKALHGFAYDRQEFAEKVVITNLKPIAV